MNCFQLLFKNSTMKFRSLTSTLKTNKLKRVFFNISLCCLFLNFGVKCINSKDEFMMCAKESFKYTQEELIELNSLEKRAAVIQQESNDPIEDRYSAVELNNFKGYYLSVLDGHGGHQLSEFANERLYKYFDNFYKEFQGNSKLTEDEIVVNALHKAFETVEKEFYEIAKTYYRSGEGRMATVGSCVSIVLISPKKVYAAQLGDSKAKLFRKNKNKGYDVVKLTQTHNAEKKREQEMLYQEFKDKDIIVCKRPNNKVCYVKGRLQPTRSLGDFHLKYREFNEIFESNYKRPISDFRGPYIKSKPEVRIFDITKDDEFLVVATDGLWDFLNGKDVAELIKAHPATSPSNLSNIIFDEMMQRVSKEAYMPVARIMSLPPGSKKRRIHDDVSMIVFDLKH